MSNLLAERRKLEGISQRMLTLTLKGLEQDGLVTRTMYPTIPPRVDYMLTPLGRKLVLPLQTPMRKPLSMPTERSCGRPRAIPDSIGGVSRGSDRR
jgi:hypothetical protein